MWKLSTCLRAVASSVIVFLGSSWASLSAEVQVSSCWTQAVYFSNSFGVCMVDTNRPAFVWPLDTDNWILGAPVTNHFSPGSGASPWVVVSTDGNWQVVDRQHAAMGPFWYGFTFVVGLGFMLWWPKRLFERGID